MPMGPVVPYFHSNSKSSFWVTAIENPVKPFNSEEFKCEFNEYIERKRQEDCWYKITWFTNKENFKSEIFEIIDRYEEAKRSNSNVDYFRNKIAKKFRSTAYAFGGIRAQTDNSDGSEMSKILMKWYYRIAQATVQPDNVNQKSDIASPRPG